MGTARRRGRLVSLTERGLAEAGIAARTPITAEEIRQQWRGALRAGARRMLDELLAHRTQGTQGMTRRELAHAASLDVDGGTFTTYLSALRSNGLVEVVNGRIRVSNVFDLAPRSGDNAMVNDDRAGAH